jgi:hypothetical protein
MKHLLSVLCLSIICSSAFSWGATGHRVTGLIASKHLNKKSRSQLERVLNGQSLDMASTWMDEIRSDTTYQNMTDWHWVTIEDGKTYEEMVKNPKGDLIFTIERLIQELKNKSVSGQKEAEYVRMLIHLIGDLHMPLHVGRGADAGGNAIKLTWFQSETNLHRVWDEDMIDQTRLSYTELASSLDKPTAAQLSSWRNSGVRDWAMESVHHRRQVYNFKGTRLSYEYSYYNMPLVKLRLFQAGVRIAKVLNDIYGK